MIPDEDEPVLAESEEEEDPDRWKDEFGCTWLRSELFPGRWYLLGAGLEGGARLGFLGSDMGCGCFFWFFEMGMVLASASFWTTFLLRGYEAGVSVYGGHWNNFMSLVCTRCLHVEIWCIIPLRPCIWQSIPRFLGVACGVRNIGFFGR